LHACNIGNRRADPSVAQVVATATGATVYAAGGFSGGSFYYGNARVNRDDRSWSSPGFSASTFHETLEKHLAVSSLNCNGGGYW
jgi:hypothetical protein